MQEGITMKRWWKFTALLSALLLTFSLLGCGTAHVNTTKDKKMSSADQSAKHLKKEAVNKGENEQQQPEVVTAPANEKSDGSTTNPTSTVGTETAKSTAAVQTNNTSSVSKTTKTTTVKPATTAAANTTTTKTTAGTTQKTQAPAATVTLSITGPKDHPSILAPVKVDFKEGDTVYTALSRVAEKQNIYIGKKGSGSALYIEGLEDKGGKWSFYEFDYGSKSGWVFKINGTQLTKSAGVSSVKAGDRIECIYVQ
jgi:hypothetical protein